MAYRALVLAHALSDVVHPHAGCIVCPHFSLVHLTLAPALQLVSNAAIYVLVLNQTCVQALRFVRLTSHWPSCKLKVYFQWMDSTFI